MPNKIFREKPPAELLEKLIQACRTSQDNTWFQKSCILLSSVEDLLPELEPYYVPCLFKDYTQTPLTQIKAVTLLRQVLKEHSMKLVSSEKTIHGVRGVWYQVAYAGRACKEIRLDFS
jgi:hypothetical protein